MNTSNVHIAHEELLNFQKSLLRKMEAIQQNDTYYQSFVVEQFRFIPPYEYYIPGVHEPWKTKYQMKSQRGEDMIQSIIKMANKETSK